MATRRLGVEPVFDGTAVFNSVYTTADSLRAKVINVLLTRKGERPMRPLLGTSLHKYVFEPLGEETIAQLEATLTQELTDSLAELAVDALTLTPDPASGHLLSVFIKFRQKSLPAAAAQPLTVTLQ